MEDVPEGTQVMAGMFSIITALLLCYLILEHPIPLSVKHVLLDINYE